MPPQLTAQQKALIAQFVSLTGASDRLALRHLKSTAFKINEAIDAYYTSGHDQIASPSEVKLNSLFDALRDGKEDEKDRLELESTMNYLGNKLNISLENAELFAVLELVQAPNVGEISRRGYVEGWKSIGEHAAYVRKLVSSLSTDPALFRKVYRYTFVVGRERDQKSLSLDNAIIYWSMLFTPPGMAWRTKNRDWLALWKSFLGETWTRSVNKDMWNMVLEFAFKSMSDDSLSFWSEDGAWPSVIDDFVAWCRARDFGEAASLESDAGR